MLDLMLIMIRIGFYGACHFSSMQKCIHKVALLNHQASGHLLLEDHHQSDFINRLSPNR